MFSPTYARARRRGPADPLDHCAINLALRGRNNAWVMSEHPRRTVLRGQERLNIGANQLQWRDDGLEILLDEVEAPLGRRVHGAIRVTPRALNRRAFALDLAAKHTWWPIAPEADVEVDVAGVRFRGSGYLDSNWGAEPLERGFRGWNWSRSKLDDRTVVHYVTDAPDGSRHHLALEFDRAGDGRDRPCLSPRGVPRTAWGVSREVVSEEPEARVLESLEDTPFYSRQRVLHWVGGRRVEGVHESLDLRRFDSRVVQHLLGYKTRRRR